MKFVTFIKAYKIALFNISKNISSWKSVYLNDIIFPTKDDILKFVFTDASNPQLGSMGVSAAINIENVERMNGGLSTINEMTDNILDKDNMAREYVNRSEKINEAGRILVLLETLLSRLQAVEPDTWERSEISNLSFNFEDDNAIFSIDNYTVYTNGILVMFGN